MRRFEVRVRPGLADPRAESLAREARAVGVAVERARVARVYLIHGALTDADADRVGASLLANPVLEDVTTGAGPIDEGSACLEVHPLPGVMDPPAQTVAAAVEELTGVPGVRASTGWRYDLAGVSPADARRLARRLLANPVIHAVHDGPHCPDEFPHAEPKPFRVTRVPVRDLDDEGLARLSREAHLFLSLDEMRAIREHFRDRGREPTDAELETLAQTWSEHCVHKTLKADIVYRGPADGIDWSGRPGHTALPDGSVRIENLLRSTVAAATHRLIEDGLDWALSVFVDNAGVIAFDDDLAVCVKVETHNHPSAIEPYGGAATGVGGCIRDIIGTGLAAKPIANTDVFCVAHPDSFDDDTLPAGCLAPRRILTQVVAGVRDYGNRMGVPTVSGGVFFDDRYVGNPLVFCGCVGVLPRDRIAGEARAGDLIVALGGRTGRDGIHGATFSSAELTDTHADEFAHAVQIGNPIEEKKLLDAILRARDAAGGPLYSAITDCGAGGFSSAVGEMGEALGAEVHLDRAPLKYNGLTYSEVWISEAQERMVLAVPPDRLDALRAICDEEHVELAVLGTFGTPDRELILRFHGEEVGRLGMAFLHDGLPRRTRDAVWPGAGHAPDGRDARPTGLSDDGRDARPTGLSDDGRDARPTGLSDDGRDARPTGLIQTGRDASVAGTLLALLAHPTIASKRWIVRQYDHEVQGATIVKPLVGPGGDGPGDATVIRPAPGSTRGLAISQGLDVSGGDPAAGGDPYLMALSAVDECVRNLVCVGADPSRIAILDNFCWPSCEKPENLAALVRAAEGCHDAAIAYRTPFISGKDSLNNQFTTEAGETIEIPPTLLITGVGIVPDIDRCVTMDLKGAPVAGESALLLATVDDDGEGSMPQRRARVAAAVHAAIRDGLILSAHDASEGGAGVAVAEMVLASGVGAEVSLDDPFAERPATYILEAADGPATAGALRRAGASARVVGRASAGLNGLTLITPGERAEVALEAMRRAFFGALDW